jgi:hypothetical protein
MLSVRRALAGHAATVRTVDRTGVIDHGGAIDPRGAVEQRACTGVRPNVSVANAALAQCGGQVHRRERNTAVGPRIAVHDDAPKQPRNARIRCAAPGWLCLGLGLYVCVCVCV